MFRLVIIASPGGHQKTITEMVHRYGSLIKQYFVSLQSHYVLNCWGRVCFPGEFPLKMNILKIIIYLLGLSFAESLNFNERIHNLQLSSSSCILKLAQQHFEPFSIISFVKSKFQYRASLTVAYSSENLILENLVHSETWSLVMKLIGEGGRDQREFGFEKTHNYIILFQDISDLHRVFRKLTSLNSWNPHAKFVLFIVGPIEQWSTFLTEVVQLLWMHWIINVAIFLPTIEFTGHKVSRVK